MPRFDEPWEAADVLRRGPMPLRGEAKDEAREALKTLGREGLKPEHVAARIGRHLTRDEAAVLLAAR